VRAVRLHGREDLRLEELPLPVPGPGEVALDVHLNGLCGTDVHEYYDGPDFVSATPHPLTGESLPAVLGHEFCGTVAELGEGVEDVALGTLVAVEPIETCGRCPRCLSGARHLCRLIAFHGYNRAGGGLSERTVVPRSMVHVVPAGLSREHAALAEPMAVALRAARRIGARAGELAVVHGAGPIGIGALLALRAQGVRVLVSDPSPWRRDVALRLGAEQALDPVADDVVAAARDLTGGLGAAGALDAAGAAAALKAAVAGTRPDGTVVVVAHHHGHPLPLTSSSLIFNEVRVTGSAIYSGEFPDVLAEMARGAYPLDGWVTTVPVHRIVEDGLEPLRAQQALKVLVDVSPPAAGTGA
jgi:(R,R)-butanediol dehydrogenase/meso-butanediol dehydrogenase/diacetyl reductase